MTNVWDVTPEQERFNYGECEILVEAQTSKKGKAYQKITFNIFPLAGTGNGNLTTASYFKFDNHTKPWDSDVLPAFYELVNQGKIKNAPEVSGKYIQWKWGQWRTYRQNDITYWVNRANDEEQVGDTEKAAKSRAMIQTDEKGKQYIEKGYIHILDVFEDENECVKAYEERYGKIEQNAADDVPGFENETKSELNTQNVPFLASYITMTMSNGKVDRAKLDEFLQSNSEQFKDTNTEIIDRAVEKVNGGMTDDKTLAKFIIEEMGLPF